MSKDLDWLTYKIFDTKGLDQLTWITNEGIAPHFVMSFLVSNEKIISFISVCPKLRQLRLRSNSI